MTTPAQQHEEADRLAAIAERIGFVLWQLQDLEGVTAYYFVLLAQAEKSMGLAEGNALVKKAQDKTFGATLDQIARAGLISSEIEGRFRKLLFERNWLVHRSRTESRNAIHNDKARDALLAKLNAIAADSLGMLKFIDAECTAFAEKHGVPMDCVEQVSRQLLEQWHAADGL